MKISSIITTGGKCLIASGIFLLFSCDSTQSLTVNGKQVLSYSLHDNEIKIAAGKFGHVLQHRKVGARAYYSIIAPESLASAAMDGHMNHSHHSFWIETWANYLAKGYFGSKWLGKIYPTAYPEKNISLFNWLRLMLVKNSSVQKPRGFI